MAGSSVPPSGPKSSTKSKMVSFSRLTWKETVITWSEGPEHTDLALSFQAQDALTDFLFPHFLLTCSNQLQIIQRGGDRLVENVVAWGRERLPDPDLRSLEQIVRCLGAASSEGHKAYIADQCMQDEVAAMCEGIVQLYQETGQILQSCRANGVELSLAALFRDRTTALRT